MRDEDAAGRRRTIGWRSFETTSSANNVLRLENVLKRSGSQKSVQTDIRLVDARPCNAALSRRWPLCDPRSSPPASRALFNLARRRKGDSGGGEVRRLSSDSAALGRAKDAGLREVKGTERQPDTLACQRKQAGSKVQQRKCTNNIKCLTKMLNHYVVQFRLHGDLSVSGELRA